MGVQIYYLQFHSVQRETLEGENFRVSVGSEHFAINQSYRWVGTYPNFVETTFIGGSQKEIVKVFSLESFQLYDSYSII